MDKELTPKQQTSEAVRQAETILIMTGQRPTIDQVSSTVALAAILRKFGKKVTAVISDDIPAGAKFLPTNLIERTLGGLRDFNIEVDLSHAEVDTLKYGVEDGKLNIHITPFAGGFQSKDVSFSHGDFHFDLVIILGVPFHNRIDKVYLDNSEKLSETPLVNIDFHRSNEQYGAINLVEGHAASLAEILMALSESLQTGLIDETIATALLAGIMAATDRFTATHTTAKAMTVAAQMMAVGADQQQIVRGLYRTDRDSRDSRDRRPQSSSQPASQPQSQPKPERPTRPPRQEEAPVRTQPPVVQSKSEEKPEPQEKPAERPPAQYPPANSYDEPDLPIAPVAKPALSESVMEELAEMKVSLESTPTPPQPVMKPKSQVSAPSPVEPSLPKEDEKPAEPAAPPVMKPESSPIETPSEQPESESNGGMEELLPPQHIEISEPAEGQFAAAKAVNPTNNPILTQNLRERG